MKLRREISEGASIPFGYGVAYRMFDRQSRIAYLIPLHLLVRYVREAWMRLCYPRPSEIEKLEAACFWKGYHKGKNQLLTRYATVFIHQGDKELLRRLTYDLMTHEQMQTEEAAAKLSLLLDKMK